MSKTSFTDPVVAEIHSIRAAMLAECDGSVAELMRQVAIRQAKSEHTVIVEPFRKRTEPNNGNIATP
jgi:hypothetical protein